MTQQYIRGRFGAEDAHSALEGCTVCTRVPHQHCSSICTENMPCLSMQSDRLSTAQYKLDNPTESCLLRLQHLHGQQSAIAEAEFSGILGRIREAVICTR
jgi:hypothetical protein